MDITKNYIVDSNNNKIAVQIPIKEFEKLEELLENHVLSNLIDEVKDGESLEYGKAVEYYKSLKKDVEN